MESTISSNDGNFSYIFLVENPLFGQSSTVLSIEWVRPSTQLITSHWHPCTAQDSHSNHIHSHTHIQMPEETNNNNRGMRQFRHKVSSTSILVVENEQFDYCLRIGIIEIAGNHTRSPNSSQVWYISIKLICLPFVWRSLCKYLLSNMIWLEIENRSSILVIRWEKGPTKNSRRKYADQPYGEGN